MGWLLCCVLLAALLLPPPPFAAAGVTGGQRLVDPGRLELVPPAPPASNAVRAAAKVDADAWSTPLPPSFLGISHEWDGIDELVDPGTLQLLRDLGAYGGGTGPLVLRVGGGSTDLQKGVPDAKVWATLRSLHAELGARFILGLNFEAGNWTLTNAQFDAARRELPPLAVLALELGNEPNFYAAKWGKPAAEYLACCYVNDWNAMAVPLSCPAGAASCVDRQLAGPAWGHVHMAPATLDWFLKVNYRWVGPVTVHWYKARGDAPGVTPGSLLDEASMRRDAASLRALVGAAGRYGRPLRVAEMNSASNNGRRGVSDALAGALWSLDAALEAAAAGAAGVNFHWGSGANTYSAVIRRARDNKPPIAKPAFYAYHLLQLALAGGGRILAEPPAVAPAGDGQSQPTAAAQPQAWLKVWPIVAVDGTARVVVINRSPAQPAVLALAVNRGHLGDGALVRLGAPGGLSATGGASLGGARYPAEGAAGRAFEGGARGEVAERVARRTDVGGNSVYDVAMPPASAALLILPAAASAAG